MSTVTEIADAVAASLNAGSFSQTFDAQRAYQPVYELPDLQALKVSVVPRSLRIERSDRSGHYFEVAVNVAVQKRVNADDLQALDDLMKLVEELADHLRATRLDSPDVIPVSVANEPIYEPDHLEQWRQFTSVLTVTYAVRR